MLGKLVWITGLSGAGKTTAAKQVFALLKESLPNTAMIDGDDFRAVFDDDLGYSLDHRVKNAHRIAKMCKYLCDQGINVVCATMSLYRDIHDYIYKNFEDPLIVFLNVPMDELKKRNKKNLYEVGVNVTGVDQTFDEPCHEKYVLKINNAERTDLAVTKIMERIKDYGTKN
jgi:adenylylsulfate kinase-like enzyme